MSPKLSHVRAKIIIKSLNLRKEFYDDPNCCQRLPMTMVLKFQNRSPLFSSSIGSEK